MSGCSASIRRNSNAVIAITVSDEVAFTVTPALVAQSLTYALVLGFFGGLMPSLRAARLPITTGLRDS